MSPCHEWVLSDIDAPAKNVHVFPWPVPGFVSKSAGLNANDSCALVKQPLHHSLLLLVAMEMAIYDPLHSPWQVWALGEELLE